MKNILLVALTFLATTFFVSHVFSHKRPYVYTYNYVSEPIGPIEVEYYTSFQFLEYGKFDKVEHQFELASGIAERLDLAIYNIFSQVSNHVRYDGFKVRIRYGLVSENDFIFDPQLYVEYKGVPALDVHKFENKLIISKTFNDQLNISINPVFELVLKLSSEPKYEGGLNAGVSYTVFRDLLDIGLEFTSKYVYGKEPAFYVGPVFSLGDDQRRWNIGSKIRLFRDKVDFEIRSLIGFYL